MQNNKGNIQTTSKYDEMLKQYNLDITDEEVKAAVKKIIEEKVPENDTLDVKKFLLGSVELTTLKTTDTEEEVLAMVEKVNKFAQEYPTLPHVGAVCAYPCFTKLIADSLEVDGVDITNVTGNFPSSQTFLEVKTIETALAIKDFNTVFFTWNFFPVLAFWTINKTIQEFWVSVQEVQHFRQLFLSSKSF